MESMQRSQASRTPPGRCPMMQTAHRPTIRLTEPYLLPKPTGPLWSGIIVLTGLHPTVSDNMVKRDTAVS